MSTKQEFLVIKKQAVHYEVSEIIRDSTTNWEAVIAIKQSRITWGLTK